MCQACLGSGDTSRSMKEVVPAFGDSKTGGGDGIKPAIPCLSPLCLTITDFSCLSNAEHLGGPLICVSTFPGRLEGVHFIGEKTDVEKKNRMEHPGFRGKPWAADGYI